MALRFAAPGLVGLLIGVGIGKIGSGASIHNANLDNAKEILGDKNSPTSVVALKAALSELDTQLRTVIDQLDMPRRQVFIEAVIMDVNVDRSLNLGIAYHAGAPVASALGPNDTFLYGGNNIRPSVLGLPNELEGLAIGLRGPTITQLNTLFPGLSIPAFGVVLHALGKDGNSNVLATPHILATDNIPAEISIGQNIPLQTNVPSLRVIPNSSPCTVSPRSARASGHSCVSTVLPSGWTPDHCPWPSRYPGGTGPRICST
jgi:hypothetical protein